MAKKIMQIFRKNKVLSLFATLFIFCVIFSLTIIAANQISAVLEIAFGFVLNSVLTPLLSVFSLPEVVKSALLEGGFQPLFTVIAVSFPPMALFFPLFTLLEQVGMLPKIAGIFDKRLRRCGTNGNHVVTMCMGLGCNAVGVCGCRAFKSPRQRAAAIVTNSFIPCSGRLPMLVVVSSYLMKGLGFLAVIGCVFLGVVFTLIVTRLLTIGEKTRQPEPLTSGALSKISLKALLYESFFEKTLKVLARAVAVAAPAGIIIWFLKYVGLIGTLVSILNPAGLAIGLDGVILLGFILGLPANEIVYPLILTMYGTSPNWSTTTLMCILIFTVFHFPCATTILTIKKEVHSIRWTILSVLIPLFIGVVLCFAVNLFT
jgi:Fe2+ transport system protein B